MLKEAHVRGMIIKKNIVSIQFEYVRCINLRAGSKTVQGMYQLMPRKNESVRKSVSFLNSLGETSYA